MRSTRTETIRRPSALEMLARSSKPQSIVLRVIGALTLVGIAIGILRPEVNANNGTVTLHPLWGSEISWQLPEFDIPEIPEPAHGLIPGDPLIVEAADTRDLHTATATAPFTPTPALVTGNEGTPDTDTTAAKKSDPDAEQPDKQRPVDPVAGAQKLQLATQDGMAVETEDVEAEPTPAASAEEEVDLAQLSTEEIIQRIQEKVKEPKEGEVRLSYIYNGVMGPAAAAKRSVEEILKFAGIFDEITELVARDKEEVIIYVEGHGWYASRNKWQFDVFNPKFCMIPEGVLKARDTLLLNQRQPYIYLNRDAELFLDGRKLEQAGYVASGVPGKTFGHDSRIQETDTDVYVLRGDGSLVVAHKLHSRFLDYTDRVDTFYWELTPIDINESQAAAIFRQCQVNR